MGQIPTDGYYWNVSQQNTVPSVLVSEIFAWQSYFRSLELKTSIICDWKQSRFGQSLLSLALLFLLVTAPDFGTLDPVLVNLQPLNGGQVVKQQHAKLRLWGMNQSECSNQGWLQTCPHGVHRDSLDRRQSCTWMSYTQLGTMTLVTAMCRAGSVSIVLLQLIIDQRYTGHHSP